MIFADQSPAQPTLIDPSLMQALQLLAYTAILWVIAKIRTKTQRLETKLDTVDSKATDAAAEVVVAAKKVSEVAEAHKEDRQELADNTALTKKAVEGIATLKDQTTTLKDQINGRMDELLTAAGQVGFDKGKIEGKAEGK